MGGKHPRKGEPGWLPRSGVSARSGRSRPSGKSVPKSWTAPFVGWDGEGIESDHGQLYALLANSTGTRLWNDAGLSTAEALGFLCDTAAAHPGSIHVCYGASYDVNMILRDLPALEIGRLWHGKRVSWDGYELEYRPRKSFTVRRWGTPAYVRKGGNGAHAKCWVPNWTAHLTVWDVIGFFQSTFVEAIKKYLGDDYPELGVIVAGKARRSQFTPEERARIEPYTDAELRALVILMDTLRGNLRDAALPVQRWDGGGAIAASLLRRERVKDAIAPLPLAVDLAAQSAYAGGRMEVMQYGAHDGPVSHYDINSAYPYRATELPDLTRGEWTRGTLGTFGMALVRWSLCMTDYNAPELFPFFYRDQGGSISFPAAGIGWHHYTELAVAREALANGTYGGSVDVLDAWTYTADDEARPFAFLPELYRQRLAWKREGSGAEKAAKIAINSTYGKLAQQLGYDAKKDRMPPFHSLVWAGYITAATRAELCRVALQNPRAVVMLATDGVYATAPLDVPVGEELGEWTAHTHRGVLVAQSGVYYVYDGPHHKAGRCRDGCDADRCETEFRRGFDDGSISSGTIRAAWARGAGAITARSTRFVGMGSALAGGDRWKAWRTWRTIDRRLALTPQGTKREMVPGRQRPDLGLVRTNARTNPAPDFPSHPYPLLWRGEEWAEEKVDGVSARTYAAEFADANV